MAKLVSDILNDAGDTYPELVSHPDILNIFNEVHNDILKAVNMVPRTSETITLAATATGPTEQALTSTVMEVSTATYQYSATSNKPLRPITVDKLDTMYPNWRGQAGSEPVYYYIEAGVLGFFPGSLNGTDPVLLYPVVALFEKARQTMTLSSPLPSFINEWTAWTNGVLCEWARRRVQADYGAWNAMMKQDINKLANYVHGMTPRQRDQFHIDIPYVRNI